MPARHTPTQDKLFRPFHPPLGRNIRLLGLLAVQISKVLPTGTDLQEDRGAQQREGSSDMLIGRRGLVSCIHLQVRFTFVGRTAEPFSLDCYMTFDCLFVPCSEFARVGTTVLHTLGTRIGPWLEKIQRFVLQLLE